MRKVLLILMIVALQYATASRDFLVKLDWLSDHIEDENLVVLEVRYYPHRYYTIGHIPGAIQVQRIKDLGNNSQSALMMFPKKETFQKTLRKWGVNNNSTVVIYDDSSTVLSARVYHLLELYGFNMNQVKILNGGVNEWMSFEELDKDIPTVKKGNVTLKKANKNLAIEWTDVYDDVLSNRKKDIVLLDARPHKLYTGEEIKNSFSKGHIPGAINVVSMDGTDGGYWISEEKLAKMYASIPKDKTVYIYCDDGFRMSLAYIQLKSLGYKHIKLYNGGWTHWGTHFALPTVEGDKPYSGGYDL